LLWSAAASPSPRLRNAPIFKLGLQQGFEAGEMGFNNQFAVLVHFPKRMSESILWSPKLDCFFCFGAVPVIAIPLAFRPAAACAVEATNGPAVQSLTSPPPHHRKFSFFGISRLESAGLYSGETPQNLVF
jgi:hypothetical protein